MVSFKERKADYIKRTSEIILNKYNGKVPKELSQLQSLPGIGTLSSILMSNYIFNKTLGIPIDSHTKRLCMRLHWTYRSTPEPIRKDLQDWLPKEKWNKVYHLLQGYGQSTCKARKPK